MYVVAIYVNKPTIPWYYTEIKLFSLEVTLRQILYKSRPCTHSIVKLKHKAIQLILLLTTLDYRHLLFSGQSCLHPSHNESRVNVIKFNFHCKRWKEWYRLAFTQIWNGCAIFTLCRSGFCPGNHNYTLLIHSAWITYSKPSSTEPSTSSYIHAYATFTCYWAEWRNRGKKLLGSTR